MIDKTTLMTFRVNPTIQEDFKTVCRLKNTTMTGELVRFLHTFIKNENKGFKDIMTTHNELDYLKKQKLESNHYDNWEVSY